MQDSLGAQGGGKRGANGQITRAKTVAPRACAVARGAPAGPPPGGSARRAARAGGGTFSKGQQWEEQEGCGSERTKGRRGLPPAPDCAASGAPAAQPGQPAAASGQREGRPRRPLPCCACSNSKQVLHVVGLEGRGGRVGRRAVAHLLSAGSHRGGRAEQGGVREASASSAAVCSLPAGAQQTPGDCLLSLLCPPPHNTRVPGCRRVEERRGPR